MSKLSKQKISLLGLMLMTASAVTAAIITNKWEFNSPRANNGVVAFSSVGSAILTCLPNSSAFQCTASANRYFTVTTAPGQITSADIITTTVTPTSINNLNTSVGT